MFTISRSPYRPLRARPRVRLLVLGFLTAVTLATVSSTGRAQQERPRVVVLAFDGVDPRTTAALMDDGKLPNLARLDAEGTFTPLSSTKPSESPVAWASFATGMNPGKTRIFDFLDKRPREYIPGIALVKQGSAPLIPETSLRVAIAAALGAVVFLLVYAAGSRLLGASRRQAMTVSAGLGLVVGGAALFAIMEYVPTELPLAIRARQGEAFWKHTALNGFNTVVLQAPMSFPVEPIEGAKILTGFGTPDVRQSWGFWSLYTTDLFEEEDSETGGTLFPLDFVDDVALTFVRGPRNITLDGPNPPEVQIPLRLTLDRQAESIAIEVDGHRESVSAGEWSEWIRVRFSLNPLIKVSGLVRFHLLTVAPNVELYMEPINWDPHRLPPNVGISYPPGFASELATAVGDFETIGWKIATNPLRDDAVDFDAMLADAKFAMENNEKLLDYSIDNDEWECLISVFLFPDRVQHMLYRFVDPDHPNHDPELALRYADGIELAYRDMDRIVGNVMKRIEGTNTTLMVVSDHGFHSFRKQFNVNTWLAVNGYMAASGESEQQKLENLFDPNARFFTNVDWSQTKAFALGLSGIYLNIAGREKHGIVAPGAEAEEVKQQMIADLLAYRDPDNGEPAIQQVYRREEIYRGPFVEEAPDLILGLSPGYRIGWQSTLGGIPASPVTPNMDNWSGDHCSMEDSPGIFFSNKTVTVAEPNILDIAPTVLDLFEIPVPGDMDGRSLMR